MKRGRVGKQTTNRQLRGGMVWEEEANNLPPSPRHIIFGFVNVRGQAFGESLNQSKINQLVDFIKLYSLDIVNLQETHISESTVNQLH